MRRAEARSAGICRPDGVARSFQVSAYKVEPAKSVFARNLLAKHNVRVRDLDEIEEGRPEVALVLDSTSPSCSAERLARTTSGPYLSVVGPAGTSKSVRPDSNPGEEMTLPIPGKIICPYFFDGSFINISRRDSATLD
jgi:hypothetical protein